ncbi:MAG TPA: hypothetical protein VMT16_13460 [Thermoanaerobaculia bacterium]|nr:hypothetical protein [Thermoanaerobaculia bacterium]
MKETAMFELKPLTREAIPRSLDKALRYRLLNESAEAVSICRDVLELEPDNQQALATLVLALTDQLVRWKRGTFDEARTAIGRLVSEYERLYYSGILHERWAKAYHRRGAPGSGPPTYDGLREAMELFERAAALAPHDNEDAILRWNACARFIRDHADVAPAAEETFRPLLE